MQCLSVGVLRRRAVSELNYLRKHALECTRLAADCMQLVSDVDSPTLQGHFLKMASVWTTEAEHGLDADDAFRVQVRG
jgi:hypothetical protein